ncbi:class I SAM-dependent methyltransferase [Candidatus Pelagibacter sp.]|nr:class I SAM-dependent methyltransferase [Candidatus Pelagibacter sp.]
MDNKTFSRQIKNQKKHWWFQARKKIIDQIISSINLKKKKNILDFGAGSGVNLDMLRKHGLVDIHEQNKYARAVIKKERKIKNLYSTLKIKKNFYDLILLADVIEHVKQPKELLKDLKKFLKKDGHILITVPAYQFLFSKKDKVLGHYRRYNKELLKTELSGFKVENISYFNTFLCIPIIIMTMLNKFLKRDYIKQVETTPNFILNKLCYIIFASEKYFIKYFNLPFGISIYVLAKND